jgi:hypothetical protein
MVTDMGISFRQSSMNDAVEMRGDHEHGACQREDGPAARSSKRGRKQGPPWRDPAQKLRATCDVTAVAPAVTQLDFALAFLAIAKL